MRQRQRRGFNQQACALGRCGNENIRARTTELAHETLELGNPIAQARRLVDIRVVSVSQFVSWAGGDENNKKKRGGEIYVRTCRTQSGMGSNDLNAGSSTSYTQRPVWIVVWKSVKLAVDRPRRRK